MLGVGKVMGLMLGPNRFIAKDVKRYTNCTAQFGLPDKGPAINVLVVYHNWNIEPLNLLNGLALGCYQPFPEVINILVMLAIFKFAAN